MKRVTTLLATSALLAGCFRDPGPQTSGDGVEATGTTELDETDAGEGSAAISESGTGGAELGPQLVASAPADGDEQASVRSEFFLWFDRAVNPNDAFARIFLATDTAGPYAIQIFACEDGDVKCLRGEIPDAFLEGGRLPPGTEFEINISRQIADVDGNTNTLDQNVRFRTLDYALEWFDDSEALPGALWGLAYAPANQLLFVLGEGFEGSALRRLSIVDGAPLDPKTLIADELAGAFGIQHRDGELYVADGGNNLVRVYTNLGGTLEEALTLGAETGLPEPNAALASPASAIVIDDTIYVSFADREPADTDAPNDVLAYTTSGSSEAMGWWRMLDANGLWDARAPVLLTAGWSDGARVLFVAAEDRLRRITADGAGFLGSHARKGVHYDESTHLQVDRLGLLYVGSRDGLRVYDPRAEPWIERRAFTGLDMSRFALREDGDARDVYFGSFEGAAVIGHVSIEP
ncbi:MAG: Ig-like domain-containing protein [Myxococcales bacterium]|nr:Ig-like domain-containing protein [Myxococcales bacterium]